MFNSHPLSKSCFKIRPALLTSLLALWVLYSAVKVLIPLAKDRTDRTLRDHLVKLPLKLYSKLVLRKLWVFGADTA